MVKAFAGAGRERRLGGATAGCSPRRLGLPVQQRPLSRCRRHRGRGFSDGPGPRAYRRNAANNFDEAIDRGREWIEGLQSRNGGWGAFDADNNYDYLNYIPFADHGALLDPPTADVSARCLSMLGQLGHKASTSEVVKKGLEYLLAAQEADGSWYGRWGMNYVYGTWSSLCALNAVGVDLAHPAMRKASDWLISIQNSDGGWGESGDSYKLKYGGYEAFESTASQTSWALLGLMAAGDVAIPRSREESAIFLKAGCGWFLERRFLHRNGFPSGILSAIPRLFKILPIVGCEPIPESGQGQYGERYLGHVGGGQANQLRLLVVSGLAAEAKIAANGRHATLCGGGNVARLEADIISAFREGVVGIVSFGIAGGLAPNLPTGAIVVAKSVMSNGERHLCDPGWLKRLRQRLPMAANADIIGADAPLVAIGAARQLWERRPGPSQWTWSRIL